MKKLFLLITASISISFINAQNLDITSIANGNDNDVSVVTGTEIGNGTSYISTTGTQATSQVALTTGQSITIDVEVGELTAAPNSSNDTLEFKVKVQYSTEAALTAGTYIKIGYTGALGTIDSVDAVGELSSIGSLEQKTSNDFFKLTENSVGSFTFTNLDNKKIKVKNITFISSSTSVISDANELSLRAEKFRVFPNPLTEGQNITVELSQKLQGNVKSVDLIALSGNTIATFASIEEISTADLAKGIYLINITTTDGLVLSSNKLVIK